MFSYIIVSYIIARFRWWWRWWYMRCTRTTWLVFFCSSSLTNSTSRHVTPLGLSSWFRAKPHFTHTPSWFALDRKKINAIEVNTSSGGLMVPEGIIHPVVSTSELTWFIRYIYYWNLQFLHNAIINKTQVLLPQT